MGYLLRVCVGKSIDTIILYYVLLPVCYLPVGAVPFRRYVDKPSGLWELKIHLFVPKSFPMLPLTFPKKLYMYINLPVNTPGAQIFAKIFTNGTWSHDDLEEIFSFSRGVTTSQVPSVHLPEMCEFIPSISLQRKKIPPETTVDREAFEMLDVDEDGELSIDEFTAGLSQLQVGSSRKSEVVKMEGGGWSEIGEAIGRWLT